MKQQPFTIAIPDHCLRDLADRLRHTRWSKLDDGDGRFGIEGAALRRLAARWKDTFDWRAVESQINLLPQFRTVVDGQPIHYLRIASREPKATPLILTHGWPWTFWDFRRVFAPLIDPCSYGGDSGDAFELIVPSLPGFGFSTPMAPSGGNFWRTADLWHRLMTECLGFERYGAAGADWGAFVSAQLGHKHAGAVLGVHLTQPVALDTFGGGQPWRALAAPPGDMRPERLRHERRFASHLAVHMIEPDTLSYALNDSPVGLLAWLYQRWSSWGGPRPDVPALSEWQMLTNATLYWATDCLPSSLRFYANAGLDPWHPSHGRSPLVDAPTGITLLAGDLSEGTDLARLVERFASSARGSQYNVVHIAAHQAGGHFAHYENPDAVVGDLRATFRAARRRG